MRGPTPGPLIWKDPSIFSHYLRRTSPTFLSRRSLTERHRRKQTGNEGHGFFFACTFIYMLIRRRTLVGVWGIPVSGWLMHSLEHIPTAARSLYVRVAQKQSIISEAWLCVAASGLQNRSNFLQVCLLKKNIWRQFYKFRRQKKKQPESFWHCLRGLQGRKRVIFFQATQKKCRWFDSNSGLSGWSLHHCKFGVVGWLCLGIGPVPPSL